MTRNRRNDDTRTYCLITTSFWRYPEWMCDAGDHWENEAGGGFAKGSETAILETVETDDVQSLDYSKTGIAMDIEKDTIDGWLAPDGRWYPCGYHRHDNYAFYMLKKSTRELEEAGWCRCHSPSSASDSEPFFYVEDYKRLTPEQRNKLLKLGFKLED